MGRIISSHGSGEVGRRWYPEHRWEERPEKGKGTAPPIKQKGRREKEKHGSDTVMFVDCLHRVEIIPSDASRFLS